VPVTAPHGLDGSTRFGWNVTVSSDGEAFAVVRYGPSSPVLTMGRLDGGSVDGRLERHPVPTLAEDYGDHLALIPE
jgi:hypothetical protein